jgi:DNA-binding GntR family transcriptional regulator
MRQRCKGLNRRARVVKLYRSSRTEPPDARKPVSRPAYLRIADDLRRRIDGGELGPGALVPSRAQLSRQYTVSDRVAVEAVKVLMKEGLVQGRPGSGTYVRHRPDVRRLHRGEPATSPAAGVKGATRSTSAEVDATSPIAGRLGIEVGAEVMRTGYVFLEAGGEPAMIATSWEPLELTGGTDVMWPEEGRYEGRGPVERMASIDITVTRTVETLSARPALEEESHRLRVPRGSVVMVLRRTCLAGDRPVETADFVVAAESHEVTYELAVGGAAPRAGR